MGDPDGAARDPTPRERGFRLPADYETHERVVISWPTMRRIDFWRNHLGAARDAYAVIIRAIAEYEKVTVVADEGEGRTAEGWLGDGIEVIELAIDDSWIRDNGPIVVTNEAGDRLGVHFDFNAWGGRVPPWDRDAAMAGPLCDHLGIEHRPVPVVLEGGAVATDGQGTLVATESSVLHPNRNPGMTKERMEQTLTDELGIERIVWLARGLADDTTNGHVDNIVAFVAPGEVLLQTTTDVSDPDYNTARDNRLRLEAAGLAVTEIDVLPHVQCFDQLVEVPYLNYFVANDAVVVPLAGAAADREMLAKIADCFPGRKPIGVPGSVLAYGGGGVHCITRAIPA
jgi:agmatine deiminase